jgi:methionyl-tRNA formyltransferase
MKIVVLAYRDWAFDVYESLSSFHTQHEFILIETPENLTSFFQQNTCDFVFVVGWSWKIPSEIVNKYFVVGMHPSDLPKYAGGSPIQNQILDGIKTSKATLFKLNEKFDEGEIIFKEPISLEGSLNEVLYSITKATIKLFDTLLLKYPNIKLEKQKLEDSLVKKRLRPDSSKIEKHDLSKLTCNKLYDMIRCREDPYPNAFIEDDTGKLYFSRVTFEPK